MPKRKLNSEEWRTARRERFMWKYTYAVLDNDVFATHRCPDVAGCQWIVGQNGTCKKQCQW